LNDIKMICPVSSADIHAPPICISNINGIGIDDTKWHQ